MTKRSARPSPVPLILHTRVVTGSGGGPDKTIRRSAQYADRRRVRIASAYIYPHHDPGMATLQKNARREGCPLWAIGESGAADPRPLRTLLQLCRYLGVSVWHGHDYKSNLYGLLLRRWWPMKLVTTVHGWTWHTTRTRFYYHIDNRCLRHYDHVIAVNAALAQHCRAQGVRPDRLSHIPNAIELKGYEPAGNTIAARRRMGIGQDRLVIGIVSRLSVEKGVDRAIGVLARLRRNWPNAQLHLVGDGPQRGQLGQLASKLGVRDAVRFWGWQNHVKTLYRAMDVLLVPSHTEGLPNVVLEAMAMGIPVAATDVGGVGDLLDHGRCGVILSQDPQTWPSRLSYLLASDERRTTITRLARTRIEDHYTFDQRMHRVLGVYQRVLGTSLLPTELVEPPLKQAA